MRRRRAALLCALLLAGCAAPAGRYDDGRHDAALPPPAAAAVAPHLAGDAIVMADGARLPLRTWLPHGRVRAVVLGVHGFNDYSAAFAAPARLLAWRGIATYAYDQRGFGRAPLRGRWPGDHILAADLVTASRLLRKAYPGIPLYIMGESMGAAVAIVAMTGAAGTPRPTTDGLILVAPAVWGWQTMGPLERALLWTGFQLFPGVEVTGRGIITIRPSDNITMLRDYAHDPLVIKATRIEAIYGLVGLMSAALAAAPRLDAPLLYLYGDKDELVPKAPTREMIESLPAAARGRQRVAWYANGYHMLLRDLDGAVVAGDIAAWIGEHDGTLPSGADVYAANVLGEPGLARAAADPPPESASGAATRRLPSGPPMR